MADSAQDKNLPASERKKQKAREDGNVARSRELGHFAAIAGGALLVAGLAPMAMGSLKALLVRGLTFDRLALGSPQVMGERLAEGGIGFAWHVVPVGLVMVVIALLASIACGGWNLAPKALQPKFSKLNPFSGVVRMFSLKQMGRTLLACVLALMLGIVGYFFLQANLGRFAQTLALPLPGALQHAAGTLWAGLLMLLMTMAAFALIDVPLQQFLWLRDLKMSREEQKQEHKQNEGNPEIKQAIRQRQHEMATKRMMEKVPSADLVVMNPTHFAVALAYDEGRFGAPRVVAKGRDLLAFRIRDIAHEAKVPVLQAPPLARALYAHVELDAEVPAALFAAVAQVLAWVYQLRAALQGEAPPPPDLVPMPLPPGLDPAEAEAGAVA